ncbi:hypothetical protein CCMSSC00406_0006454 [Pleurotus cornucopiae]|uniref:Uncharacterized protein n=1 Tax=Pleurotus cornucopiae TaxID=5321 RepID=A0ACB7J7Z3_PLECO|nr:hypothetical protein CCMSSC00406_0006454 [Pleurotus cornucopiae]
MSHFSTIGMQEAQQQQPLVSRPTMRRKSSAQNLLSSFKGSTPGTGATSATNGLPYTGASTPTATGPMGGRDIDVQSLHSDTVAAMGAGSPALGPGTSVEYLRDLVQKRIITLTYIRNIHEGRSHWFHTILMSRAELDHEFNNNAMKKRTFRFAVLGMSLANLLDIQQAPDLLRGLLNTLAEYETEDGDKSKMRLFRSKLKRQTGGGFTEYAVSYTDASDASYLMTPHMPFPLDYHQTLLSLLDVLSEVYNKMLKILGPSPFPHSAQMMGPLGLLSPHPGVSYLFPPENQSVADDGSLWGIANANPGTGGQAGAFMYGGGLSSPPAGWSQSLSDTILKIDGKFKKIITTLLKELDDLARSEIQDELASLDPLLRSGSSVGREPYEFDVM